MCELGSSEPSTVLLRHLRIVVGSYLDTLDRSKLFPSLDIYHAAEVLNIRRCGDDCITNLLKRQCLRCENSIAI